MPALKMGLIGCGRIAQSVHLNILTSLSNVKLVALAEPDPQRLEAASHSAPHAVALTDYQELLAMPEVEAVVVCAPSWLHAEVGIATLNSGKHLYLEKPFATTLADGKRIIAAWQQSQLKGMIGFNYRFNPLHLEARALIQSSRIGPVMGARTIFTNRGKELSAWLRKRQTGGGVLLELASHHFDLLYYLLDSPVHEVNATIRSLNSEDDYAALTMKMADDTIVQSMFSFDYMQDDRIEIYGQKAKLVIDRFRSLRVELTEGRDANRLQRLRHMLKTIMRSRLVGDDLLAPTRELSYEAALSHFVDCVLNNQEPSPNLWDGYRSLAVVNAAEESAKTGQTISIMNYDHENTAS